VCRIGGAVETLYAQPITEEALGAGYDGSGVLEHEP
jgi:hypothetical protein